MIGLLGTRVIVIDDQETEALPILKAFAKEGVPTAFFDGEMESLPEECLQGIRLAILDMDLIGGTDPKSKVSALVNYLKRILRPDNGPYAIIAWTNHIELLESFEKSVFSEKDIPNPVLSLMLTKAECKDKHGNFSLAVISEKLERELSNLCPLVFLQHWEERCFLAATEVTNGLSALLTLEAKDLKEYREQWKNQFLKLLRAMAKAQADQHLEASTCLTAIYGLLGPLYADRMESHAADLSSVLDPQEILETKDDCGPEKKARINTMLHLAYEGLERFSGGNLYMFPNGKPSWLPDGRQLIEDFSQGKKGAPETLATIDHLMGIYTPALIEMSANCDHAQKNIRVARFLFGLVLPTSENTKIKKAEFIWKFGPLFLENQITAGNYFLYISARHLVSHELERVKEMTPYARLRSQALIDLQSWFARQAARPGMILL